MKKWAYYNEVCPFAAQWTKNLMRAGLIPAGDVDERSIADVSADDVRGYRQCHWFSGIGVWAYALRLAGWGDDRPCWTGSAPCQPWSVAGTRSGTGDERHLWPAWFRLIAECRPDIVFGEQVASPAALGWLDHVFDDLEGTDYACGAVDFPACSIGAPHIRQRLFWVADATRQQLDGCGRTGAGWGAEPSDGRGDVGLGDARGAGLAARERAAVVGAGRREEGRTAQQPGGPPGHFWQAADWLYCRDGKHRPAQPGVRVLASGIAARVGKLRAYGNCIVAPQAKEFVMAFMECRP